VLEMRTAPPEESMVWLTPGSFYRFQVRALTRVGMGDWSEPVTFTAGQHVRVVPP